MGKALVFVFFLHPYIPSDFSIMNIYNFITKEMIFLKGSVD